ncbi:MAG: serine/threonine-protein kinase [Gemmatimonadota bacterium]
MASPSHEFLDLQVALAGEYSLERELGRGGMGVVYLARDVQLDRHVAIKVLPAHLAEQPESRERFLREARTAAGLSHPNIVPIHRVGEAAGFVFFVMSYVAGKTLGERLREQGPLGAAEAARMLREVAWGRCLIRLFPWHPINPLLNSINSLRNGLTGCAGNDRTRIAVGPGGVKTHIPSPLPLGVP